MQVFLDRARRDAPVYLSEVRARFEKIGTRPFRVHLTLYDESVRVFSLLLPVWQTEEERDFVRRYVHAVLYNLLSALGARRVDVYINKADEQMCALAEALPDVFDAALSKGARQGYGKCLNVNERVLAAIANGEFLAFCISDVSEEPLCTPNASVAAVSFDFAALPLRTAGKLLLGMDVGGTDVKLVAAHGDALLLCAEFDWNPGAAMEAAGIVEPLCALAAILLYQANLLLANRADALLPIPAKAETAALWALAEKQRSALEDIRLYDGIGLCFPDVVVRDRILGGETAKTRGMRENLKLDYEKEFAKVAALPACLAQYVLPDGPVRVANDGEMAAYTAAVERAAGGADVSAGFFAHTLGTELGTGWVKGDGSIPEIPLEVYNFIIDLGSAEASSLPAADARSVVNVNTGLAGTLQRYASQSGAFRLAAKYIKEEKPLLWERMLERRLFEEKGGLLFVPGDARKAALAYIMEQVAQGEPVCCAIFREIGGYLAEAWKETEYVLHPIAKDRALYGRMVKDPACFAELLEGARERQADIRLHAADEGLAYSPLMRALAQSERYTVAQFGQAVGAVHYASARL